MRLEDYPPQEPLSALGQAYQAAVLAAGAGVAGDEFAYGDDPYQRLAVHRPDVTSGDVLLFFHGGGWTSGYKEWMSFMAPALNAHGVAFVSAGYRLAPRHLFPTALDDAAAAFAWVHSHAAELAGDSRHIFVGGHSAGGHYASLLAVTGDWRARLELPADAVRGCLPVSGVFRLDSESGLSVRPRFLGPAHPHDTAPEPDAQAAFGIETEDTAPEASPLLRIDARVTPPFLLSWGSRDFAHLAVQARQMAEALRAAAVPVDTFVLEGCDHFEASLACGDARSGWPAHAAAWMRAVGRTKTQRSGGEP